MKHLYHRHVQNVQRSLWTVLFLCGMSWSLAPSARAVELSEVSAFVSHVIVPYTDDLDGLLDRRLVRVLTTFNKTNFFIHNHQFYGFEYSLLKAYEKFLNAGRAKGEAKITVEFIPVARDELLPALLEGIGDIAAAGLTITPERLASVDFTDPYVKQVDEVLVTNTQMPEPLHTLDDLSGRVVFVRKSSSYYESLNLLNQDLYQERRNRPLYVVPVDESLETEDILEIVNSGAWDITIADSTIANIWSGVFENIQVHDDVKLREGGQIAWMVRKDNPALKHSLNAFLKTHQQGTLLGNIYFNRYFKQNTWIHNPLEAENLEKRREYMPLFKHYAAQYDFDWLLIMALAYQESSLNHDSKGPDGGVGIMQVRPSTAADTHIQIQDVTQLEQNIHAGVKYLAFLRDRYFSNPRLTPQNRIRLTLAAYNRGPKKIRQARHFARQMGLNPDKWFGNVEAAVLKHFGYHTVQYVSNINKYYVLYTFYEEQDEKRQNLKQRELGEE